MKTDLKCPSCSSKDIRTKGRCKRSSRTRIQQYECRSCGRDFLDKCFRLFVDETQISCSKCGSSDVKANGFDVHSDGNRVPRYRCISCKKSFLNEYKAAPAQLAEEECPQCGSFRTTKTRNPKQTKHGTVNQCTCKDCGKRFNLGGRKVLRLFLNGEKIHSCWDPPGLQAVPGAACPACGQENAVLKRELKKGPEQGRRVLVCLGCGRLFEQGASWTTGNYRTLGKTVPRRIWQLEDDTWDLRELYPSVEEYKFKQLFLNFSNCGSPWFKKLIKKYVLWRLQTGSMYGTLSRYIGLLGYFSRFLCRQSVTSIEGINRLLLATYWTQERANLSARTLSYEMDVIKDFFDWGNAEKYFQTSSTLITTYDRPKCFHNEPDPLEDHVLEAIRDNLHTLPEPLQLMFMLGFWLGARPSELCYLHYDCIKLDPDGSNWWVEFERQKPDDEHKLPLTTDLVRLIQQQQNYITGLHGKDYLYLFCQYQGFWKSDYPEYRKLKAIERPPIIVASANPMVKAIRHLIEQCNIRDSNGQLITFTGAILRPSRATQLIREGFSLEFVRIWLKHRSATTTKRHYTRYRPGELLDVACVMANLDGKFIPYDSNPESLRQNPEMHELDGLKMPNGEPLYGYCTFREFCPRFGHCYTCGFHVASADKLPHYKAQLKRLRVKKTEVFNYGSSEMLESYIQIVNALEGKIEALEKAMT